jgi:ribosomal RNA assembly protein
MKTIYSEKIARVIKARKRLMTILKVKIDLKGTEVIISGKPEDEYIAEKVIDALNFGFPFQEALAIKQEDKEFDIIHIKDHTHRKDLKTIRARIIGRGGKALSTLTTLTNCHFELKDNSIGIIGKAENIENGIEGIISIIRGSKHGDVYKGLEKHQPQPILDLGLKEET